MNIEINVLKPIIKNFSFSDLEFEQDYDTADVKSIAIALLYNKEHL